MTHSNMMLEDIKMALETIRTHKVRSFLTVLGVVIGTMVAILVASILLGVEKNVQDSLNEFGVDNLFVLKFDPGIRFGRLSPEERTRKPLTYEDGIAIKEELPAVKDVVIEILSRIGEGPQPIRTARYKSHELTNIVFRGMTSSYAEVVNGRMKEGRFYTEQEDLHRADVVVIGYDAEKSLFPDETAEGKQLLVDGNLYTVIGVFDKKKSTLNQAGDVEVFIPYRTYKKHYPQDDEIALIAGGLSRHEERSRRPDSRAPAHAPPRTAQQARHFWHQQRGTTGRCSSVTSWPASSSWWCAWFPIGLLVGGVGVMNIMLMSVTERTREIGVRKAIGARKRDISFQFITEAMTLTGIGGILGVVLSLIFSFLMQLAHFPSSVPVWAIFLAVGVASSVGLFFGIYPAVKAARLDPVIALRYE